MSGTDNSPKGQGFRSLTERWTRERVEAVIELLHQGDREKLATYLADHVPRVIHASDPVDMLDLKGLHFSELSYRADLGQVTFRGLNLWSCRIEDVNLRNATFENCFLGLSTFHGAYLRGATFRECDMHGTTFLNSNLDRVKFIKAQLRHSTWNNCKIDIASFPPVLEEVHQKYFAYAREVYKALRLNLRAAGDETGASWAAYNQQVMDRYAHLSKKHYARWFLSWILDLMWGYGEKPARLFLFSIGFCILCAGLYFFTGVHINNQCSSGLSVAHPGHYFLHCVYFSFITFTTVGYGDLSPCTNGARVVAVMQAFSGVFIMGLFVSANARKLGGGS
jgi:hypothetical protein